MSRRYQLNMQQALHEAHPYLKCIDSSPALVQYGHSGHAPRRFVCLVAGSVSIRPVQRSRLQIRADKGEEGGPAGRSKQAKAPEAG